MLNLSLKFNKQIPSLRLSFGVFLCIAFCVNAQTSKDTIRVMSFNILHGATVKNDFNLDTIAGVINRYNPDLVAMQEVDFKTNRAKKLDLATELGQKTKMASLFAKAMPYDGGAYGEAVLSNYTFIRTENIKLPHLPTSEPRAALKTVVETKNGNRIVFVGTHLDHLEEDTNRIMQAKALVAALKHVDLPMLLVGDLNDSPTSKTLSILQEVFRKPTHSNALKNTCPASDPSMCIDHILFDKKHDWEVLEYEVLCENYASDHCIVYATLVFRP